MKTTPSSDPKGIVIFVEGETERVFYTALLNFLDSTLATTRKVSPVIVKNIKGVGNYSSKAAAVFKGDVLRNNKSVDFRVYCAYDTDVFELKQKPPVSWSKVEADLIELGALTVEHIKAVKMIEDWFLIDINGLCNYLSISIPKNLKGKNANEKMKTLFMKKNKIYTKGSYCHKFIDHLDFNLITSKLSKEFKNLIQYIYT